MTVASPPVSSGLPSTILPRTSLPQPVVPPCRSPEIHVSIHPSQVVQLHPEDNCVTVDTLGVQRRVSCMLLEEPSTLATMCCSISAL